jgi:Glycosyl transferases group 1
MLAVFRDLGVQTILTSSDLSAEWGPHPWNHDSISSLRARYVADVWVHQPSSRDRRIARLVEKGYRRLRRIPPPSTRINTPPGMRRWFTRVLEESSPDLVLMNYVSWDGLLNHRRFRSVRRAVDLHDLVTLNHQMWRTLVAALPPFPVDAATVPESVISLDFYTKLGLRPDPAEFHICDRYEYTISITQQEAEILRASTRHTDVVHIPMTQPVVQLSNTYTRPALFVTGPNPFNVQGYVFFVRQVLPRILKQLPDFALQVTGACCANVSGSNGIVLSGFVPDLAPVYEHARFAICPVFGLTGQQVKIVEAMAHGVPVIALAAAAQRSPIEHEVNGLIAHDAAEFADSAIRLWKDRAFCRRLGAAARETIDRDFSAPQFRSKLATLVFGTSESSRNG